MPIVTQRPDVPNSIINLLSSPETKTKTSVAEVLSVICVSSPIGLQNVVSLLEQSGSFQLYLLGGLLNCMFCI